MSVYVDLLLSRVPPCHNRITYITLPTNTQSNHRQPTTCWLGLHAISMKVCARALFPPISPPFLVPHRHATTSFSLAVLYIGAQYPSLLLIVSIKQFCCDSLLSKQQWTVSFILLYTVTESIRLVKIQFMVCVQSFYDIQCPTKSVVPVCSW
jgi:hypothetical protein